MLAVLILVAFEVERPPGAVAVEDPATVQELIDAADAGATVVVPAGTYVEDLVIDKALTLNCANVGISAGATPGTRGDESTIQGQAKVTSEGVTIDGCRFVRPAVASSDVPRLVRSEGVTGQVVIRNSVFDLTDDTATTRASRGCGAGVSGTAAWRVSDSQFRNQFYSQFTTDCGNTSQRYGSRMIFAANAQPVVVEGNRFESVSQSVFLTGTQPSGSEIVNNLFFSSSALFLGETTGVVFVGNTIDRNGGVYLDGSADTVIENNLLTDHANSTYLVYTVGSTTGTIVRNNAILGKYTFGGESFVGFAVFNLGSGAMDATRNWWGVTTEDEISDIIRRNGGGAVTFEPWLDSGESVGNPSSPYNTGFWPPLPGRFLQEEEAASQEPVSGPIPVGGNLSAPAVGEAVWQQDGGSTVVLEVSSPAAGQIRYEADGVQLTLAGSPGTSTSEGLVVGATGAFTCEICGTFAAGSVIEVWMFSEPRLVAAWRVEDLPCQTITIPVGQPLDGGGPVPVGVHTLQLVLPTASGVQAVNVGVTVGGPVPTSIPAGLSPSVSWSLSFTIILAVLLLGAGLVRRMARAAGPA